MANRSLQHWVDDSAGRVSREIFVNQTSTIKSRNSSLPAPGCSWGMRVRFPIRVITSPPQWAKNR